MNAVTETKYLDMQEHGLVHPLYEQIDISIDPETRSEWVYMKPRGRACFTLGLLSDIHRRDRHFAEAGGRAWHDGKSFPIDYSVVASADPGAFSWGGDLALFVMLIKARDRKALMHYATSCVEIAWRRLHHYGGKTVNISLLEGDALGGGFECALTSDVIIAEEQVQMGFPEILFNLFPGMGASALLTRRIGAAAAEKILLSGALYPAQALKEMGVVDLVVPRGQGKNGTLDFMRDNRRRLNGMRGIYRCRESVQPVSMTELLAICEVWTEAALQLEDRDLKMMQRLVKSQSRRHSDNASDDSREPVADASSEAGPANLSLTAPCPAGTRLAIAPADRNSSANIG